MKKVKVWKIIEGIAFAIIVVLFLYSQFRGDANLKCPFSVTIAGTEVDLNQTTVSELEDKGYEIVTEDRNIKAKSYKDKGIQLCKDGKRYAFLTVANFDDKTADVSTCRIIEMRLFYSEEAVFTNDAYFDAEVSGFNPRGMTMEEVKSKINKKPSNGYPDMIVIESGDYHCDYTFDKKGKTSTVEVGIDGKNVRIVK